MPDPSRARLTVLIPTLNAATDLAALLPTLVGLADEVLVVDSGSADDTVAVARRHGARVLEHPYETSARQKNWAIPQATHPWVLVVDADERPEPALADEIRAFLADVPDGVDLAWIPRKNLFWGRWMRHASDYPDRQSRLFRRDRGRYQDRTVHAHVEVPGQTVTLRNHLIHDDFTSLASWWLRSNRYFRYEVAEAQKQGRRWTFRRQFVYPVLLFGRSYLGRGGFRHGFPGFLRAFLGALYYFMTQARLYEHERTAEGPLVVREKATDPH